MGTAVLCYIQCYMDLRSVEIFRDSVRWWGLLLVVRNFGISDHDIGPHTHRATMIASPHRIIKLYETIYTLWRQRGWWRS
jgi:hypothetical protein